VKNWGVAIIIVTIIIKLIFFPLSAASYKSMAKMRIMAPKLQKLKEIHGDDRQKLHQAMMELYKTEKINPLGGCLPIVIQIPVFIALYWVLLGSVEMRQAPFMLWIQDLSRPDPFYVLPILMGISMIIQTRLNPEPPDPIQAKVMKIMPIAFSVFFFFFPAGLVLYWLVNNILSIGQQWAITRRLENAGLAVQKR
jgi:YidC/Oxa1 family membrane protein insertase